MKLYDYQEKCIEDLRRSYRQGHRAPVLVLPTGGGKTMIFSHITHARTARGKATLILTHRIELVEQVIGTLRRFCVAPGVIAAGYEPDYGLPVQVGSVQSVIRRLEKISPPDMIIADECHHAIGKSAFGTVIKHFPQALVLGVTATPYRLSGEGLDDLFDDLVLGPSMQNLIDLGRLSPVTVYAPPPPDLSAVSVTMGDYEKSALFNVMSKRKLIGNAVDHYRRLADGRRAIAFCVSIAHCRLVAEQFKLGGYACEAIDGSLSANDRRNILAAFRAGTIQILTSCELVSEGFDLPDIEVGILLRPTRSLSKWLQMVGRTLRACEGKRRALILDHAGNTYQFGLPTDGREWNLRGQPRTASGNRNNQIPSLRICPACFAANGPGAAQCNDCGAPFVSKQKLSSVVEGQLEEVKQQPQRSAKQQRNPAQDLRGLIELGRMRGYKSPEGWAKHILEARQKKRRQHG